MMNPVLPRRSHCRTSILDWRPVFLAALTLALAAAPVAAISPRHPTLEIDQLDPAELDELLDAEVGEEDLYDCGWQGPNAAVRTADMENILVCAFSDQGDDGEESGLDYEDLDQEMREAGTTLRAVIRTAVQQADALARATPEDDRAGPLAAGSPDAVGRDGADRTGTRQWAARPDGVVRPNAASAANFAKAGARNTVYAVRR